ncbi:MAG TPA: hypothetical protein PLG15_03310 [Candidatus Gastranaerophilaceae bacterium]|nr:hypothetical protein [Candidatus Gastranaerophilaceae bacterium]HPT41393.1 hypothetical protein [Candidatus Gastranaerophilaceae bacterium]
MKSREKIVKQMQEVVEQMRLDDIQENPDIVNDFFDCDCCGKFKCLAGSIQYGDYRLCNDCVLYAELGFELKTIKTVDDLIEAMEDKKLEEICEFIRQDTLAQNN